MTRLSDTQRVILSAASQRKDGAVLPLPETLKIAGGAVNKVIGGLKAKGLIKHQGAPCGDDPPPLRITRAGLEAIGVEPEGGEASTETSSASKAGSGAIAAKTGQAHGTRQGPRRQRPRRPRSPRRAPGPSRPR